MTYIQNVVEYYDELYPVTEAQKKFYQTLKAAYKKPVKFLQIGCGTGGFEHILVKDGSDVTGLEVSKELVAAAGRRRRTQLTAVRFFQLSTRDMARFLGKGFYNIISCLNNRIVMLRDEKLLRNFFFDCKTLLSKNGTLVLQLYNFQRVSPNGITRLPPRESIRVKTNAFITSGSDGRIFLNQSVETGSGRILPVIENEELYPLTKKAIFDFAKDAGFTDFAFYGSFAGEPFGNGDTLVCAIR